jgi:hypothetical protein
VSISDDPELTLEERIAWILANPRSSAWLKQALESANGRDPVAVLNDLEILNLLLRKKAEASIQNALSSSPSVPSDASNNR